MSKTNTPDPRPVSLTGNSNSYLLAIDPGNTESAFVLVDAEDLKPYEFNKVENSRLLQYIFDLRNRITQGEHIADFIIERVASYGMAVGRDVFETCEWIGRFTQCIFSNYGKDPEYIYRKEELQRICGVANAKDANIRRALIDRFAQHDLKNGKGTKKFPDWFYGFHDDIWSAYAVAVAFTEREKEMASMHRWQQEGRD